MASESRKARVIRARSWDELPEILPPGTYYVGDVKVEIRERVSKEEAMMVVSGIKHFAKEYYG